MTYKKTFGLTIYDVSLVSIVEEILRNSYSRKIIVTPNVDHVNRYHRNTVFRSVYDKADIYINDSQIIKKLSRFAGQGLTYTNAGSDLTATLFQSPKLRELSVCAIGASEDDIEIIRNKYGLDKINHFNPTYGFINNDAEIAEIVDWAEKMPTSIFFIAVGSPQQEILASKLRDSGIDGTFICCGASLLFLSGREKRAPKLIQSLSLEWFYRLLNSPKRLYRRYLIDGPYIFWLAVKYFSNNE